MKFTKGLHKDNHESEQPTGSYRDAKNIVINRLNGRIENEQGTVKSKSTFSSSFVPVGSILLSNGKTILFVANSSTQSQIVEFDPTTLQTKILVSDITWPTGEKLAFPSTGEIEGEFRINEDLETVIYWTDNVNPPRFLNLAKLNANADTQIVLETLELFPKVTKAPYVSLVAVNNSGGVLTTGIYQFAVSYVSNDLTPTNYLTVSNPIPISDDVTGFSDNAFDGSPNNTATGKSITLNVLNIDSNYRLLRVAIIKDGTTVSVLPNINVPSGATFTSLTYTGSETLTNGSLNDIIINSASYLTAKTIKQNEGTLYMGNMTRKEDINYQKYANNIKVKPVYKNIGGFINPGSTTAISAGYKDPSFAFDDKGYRRDEVYAFYIAFIKKDGSETKAYHIPGRESLDDSNAGKAVGSIEVTQAVPTAINNGSGYIAVLTGVPAQGAFASGGGIRYTSGTPTLGQTYVIRATLTGPTIHQTANLLILPTDDQNTVMNRIKQGLEDIGTALTNEWTINSHVDGPGSTTRLSLTSKVKSTTYNGQTLVITDIPDGAATGLLAGQIAQDPGTTGGKNDTDNAAADTAVIQRDLGADINVTFPAQPGNATIATVVQAYVDHLNTIGDFNAEYTASVASTTPGSNDRLTITAKTSNTVYNNKTGTFTLNSGITVTNHPLTILNARSNATDPTVGLLFDFGGSFTVATATLNGLDSILQVSQKIYNALTGDATFNAEYDATLIGAKVDILAKTAGTASNKLITETLATLAGTALTLVGMKDGVIVTTSGESAPLTVANGQTFTEVGGFAQQKMFHFNAGPDPVLGMAYWENSNEVYPNTDDFDVWDVVSGVGQAIAGKTLKSKPVRHHHFPDFASNPHYQGNDISTNASIQGFKLEDVKIPDDIKKDVVGWKVYYAKRTAQNKRILDQSIGQLLSTGVSHTSEGRLPNPAVDYADFDANIRSFVPFSTMKDRPSIGAISHIKIVCTANPNAGADAANPDDYIKIGDAGLLVDHAIKATKAKAFVPAHTLLVLLKNLGFTKDMNNNFGISKLVIELVNDIPKIDLGGGNFSANTRIWNLCQHKVDVYNSFETQQLIWTGYTHTDLNTTISADIYGGDTFISYYAYKAHRLVIDNSYLHKQVVESDDNIGLRNQGTATHEIYYPKSPEATVLDPPIVAPVVNAREYDNYIAYDSNFSKLNETKPAIPFSSNAINSTKFPTRVIRSAKDVAGLDGFRVFKENDHIDLPKNRGVLTKVESLNNFLILHMERALYRTRGREELTTKDFRAFLGTGDIFAITPEELYVTTEGYGGLQHSQCAIVTPLGYFFVDHAARKAFMLSDRLNEISTIGLREYFKDNLEFKNKGTLRAAWDNDLRRILFTKADGASSFTLSFLPDHNIWASFHSYNPIFYFSDLRNFYSINKLSPNIHKHNVGERGNFYGSSENTEFSFVSNPSPDLSKRIGTIEIIGSVFDKNNKELPKEAPLTTFQVTNSYQDTGVITPEYLTDMRRTKQVWSIDKLRDSLAIPEGTSDADKYLYQKRLEDIYHVIKIIYTNKDNKLLSLLDLDAGNITPSQR